MKANFSKKEIRANLEAALISEIEKMEGSGSSRKIRKVVRKVSKSIAPKVRMEMKKKMRKASRKIKEDKRGVRNSFTAEAIERVENGNS